MNQEITTKNQLINYIESGFKPKEKYKVGVEFESFLYNKKSMSFIPHFDTNSANPSITSLLNGFNSSKWKALFEDDNILGLFGPYGNISLEPAGQFEFSSNPAKDLNELNNFVEDYFNDVVPILNAQNIGMYNLGFNPKFSLEELPLMPKERYNFMYSYMPRVGSLGRYMMKKTATLQTNLDFSSEQDLAKKLRVSLALQPVVGAMYANSPFSDSKVNGDLSHRIRMWLDTDNARSGLLPFVFNEPFSVEKYVDYALLVPMYFVYRDGKYIKIPNISFRDYITKKYKFNNIVPIVADFELHLSTLFPDVRIKTYLETRLADCPDKDYLLTLSALFVGLLYDSAILDSAYDLVKSWTYEEVSQLKLDIIKQGLSAKIKHHSLKDLSLELLSMAYQGLVNRRLNEEIYLTPLVKLIQTGKTLAEHKLDTFNQLGGNMDEFIKTITINK